MANAAEFLRFSTNKLTADYKLRTRTAVPGQNITVTNISPDYEVTVVIAGAFDGATVTPSQVILVPNQTKTFTVTYDIAYLETLPAGTVTSNVNFAATARALFIPTHADVPPPSHADVPTPSHTDTPPPSHDDVLPPSHTDVPSHADVPQPDTVTILPASQAITTGADTTFTAIVRNASGTVLTNRLITWSSSNSGVATISTNGMVMGATAGTATITATSPGAVQGTATITVTQIVEQDTITISPASYAITTGNSITFTAMVKNANGVQLNNPVTWNSSNPGVATVVPNGIIMSPNAAAAFGAGTTVTGVTAGTAYITATSGGMSSTATITVSAQNNVVTVMVLSENRTFTGQNEAQQYTAQLMVNNSPVDATFTWSLGTPFGPPGSGFSIGNAGSVVAQTEGFYSATVIATVDTPIAYRGATDTAPAVANINPPVSKIYTLELVHPETLTQNTSDKVTGTIYEDGVPTDIPVSFTIAFAPSTSGGSDDDDNTRD